MRADEVSRDPVRHGALKVLERLIVVADGQIGETPIRFA
jgi:hypothetical protein